MTLVSIITPLYRSERTIAATLLSALRQTHVELEVIAIDDGSPDRSAAICEAFQDPRVRVFRERNRGPCRARNIGISRARGELIAFLDHDDLWLPEKLERHIAHLASSPRVGVSFGPSAFIDENGDFLGLYQTPKLTGISARDILCRNPIGNGSAPVIRREVLEEVRFCKEREGNLENFYFDDECARWEDVECWVRIAVQTSWQFEGIRDCLTLYRVSPEGFSADAEAKQLAVERGLERIRLYAPELATRYGEAAKGYHLRYLARRLVRSRDGTAAIRLMRSAMSTYPKILWEEPGRSLLTLATAYALRWLPRAFFDRLEAGLMRIAGARQLRNLRAAEPTADRTRYRG